MRSLESGQTHYTSNVGILELRKALSAHLELLYKVSYDPAEIVISVGGSEALYLAATAIIDPGDEVIIPTPCFVAYQAEVHLAGGVPVEVPSRIENNFEVDPRDVAAAITPRTKAILLGYPSNPTGAVAPRETLLEIARLAEEHDLIVFSDEIYDRLVYGTKHICFSSLPGMWKRTILLGGFSKDYAMTGWRIGYAAGPHHLMQGLLRIHQYTVMCASTTAQVAAIEAMLHGEEDVQTHAGGIRPPAQADRRRDEPDRPEHLRAARRVLRLPAGFRHRAGLRDICQPPAAGGESGGHPGRRFWRRRRRVSCAAPTPPPTKRSKKH